MMQSPSKLQPLNPTTSHNNVDGPPPTISAPSPSRTNTQRTFRAAARAARAAARASQSDNPNSNSNSQANTLGYEASFLASESTRFFGKTPSQNRILTADLLLGNDDNDDGLDDVTAQGKGGGRTGQGGKDRHALDESHRSGPMTFHGSHAKLLEASYKKGARHSFDAGRHQTHRRGSNPPPMNHRSKRHSAENIAVSNAMGKSNGSGPNNYNRRRNSKGLDGSDRSGGLSRGSFRADRTNVGNAGRKSDYGGRKSHPLLDASDKSLNYNRLFETSDRSNMNMNRKHMEMSGKSNEFTARRKSSGHIPALSNSGNSGLERRRHGTLLEAGQDTAQSSGRRPRQGNNGHTRQGLSNSGSSDNVKRRGSNRVGPYHSQKSRESNKSSDEEGGLLTPRDIDAQFDRIQNDGRGKRGSASMDHSGHSGNAGKGRPHFAPPIVSDQSSIDWGDEGEGSPKNTATANDGFRGATRRPNGGSGTMAKNVDTSGNTTSKTFVIRTKTRDGEAKERFLDVANMDDAPKLRMYNERGDLVEDAAAGTYETDSVLAVAGPRERIKFDSETIKNQSLNIQTFRTKSYYMGQKSQRPQDALPLVDESDKSSLEKLDSMKNVLNEERNRRKRSIIDKDFNMGVHKKRGLWGLCSSGSYGRRSGDSVRNVSKKRHRRKCMILIAMPVAILGGVAAALYFLVFRKDANGGDVKMLENVNGGIDSSTYHSENAPINTTNEMTNSTSNTTLLTPGNSTESFLNDTTSTTQYNDTISNSTTQTVQKNVTNSNITDASISSEIDQGLLTPASESATNTTNDNETAYPTFSFTYVPTLSPTLFPGNFTGDVPSIASGFNTPTFSPVPSYIGANATNPSYGYNDTIFLNSTSEDLFITNDTVPSNSSESIDLPENSFPSNTTVGNLTDANSTMNWDDSFINETIIYGPGENSTLNMTDTNPTVSTSASPTDDSNVTGVGSGNPQESLTLPTTNLETILNATDSEVTENLDTNSYKQSFSIIGPSPSSRFGNSVAISADGSLIAIGANEALNEAGEAVGAVFLYSLEIVDGLQSHQLLQVINGTVPNGEFGNSIGLSNDGIRIIIGSRSESGQMGAARIYNRANSTGLWELMGESIPGQYEIGRTGWSVSISGDGNVVAIGSPKGGSSQGGSIATYKFEDKSFSWQLYNGEIEGVVEEFMGFSVSLTFDGSLIATGSPKATAALGSANGGKVGIYKQGESWNWTPLLDEIFGQNADDNDGSSVAVSQDGSILVSGAKGWDGDAILDSGYCRIHELQNNQLKLVYTILGQEENEQMGSAVAVSAEGSVIACGGPNGGKDNTTDSGVVRVWNRNTGEESTIWPLETDIDFQGSLFGASLTVSADGQVLVVGAPDAINRTGAIQVYYRS